MEIIKIKYHAFIDTLAKKGDWIDLRASEDVDMKSMEFKLIPLGVSMKLPVGYEAHVLPRSSTYKNFGIIMANSMGIIDNAYGGTNDIWHFPAICLKDETHIKKGDRIAQFRIVRKQPYIEVETVNQLGEDRGGFGSTGIR